MSYQVSYQRADNGTVDTYETTDIGVVNILVSAFVDLGQWSQVRTIVDGRLESIRSGVEFLLQQMRIKDGTYDGRVT